MYVQMHNKTELTPIEILVHGFQPSDIIMRMRYNVNIDETFFSQLTRLLKTEMASLVVSYSS